MCAPPNPRLITGIGAISAARRSFHLTMLDEPTKSTWQAAGGAARSASTKRAISGAKSSSVAEIGPGAVWASVTAANSAIATADKAKQRIRRRYVAMMFPSLPVSHLEPREPRMRVEHRALLPCHNVQGGRSTFRADDCRHSIKNL